VPSPSSGPRAAVILLAAGEGRRVGADTNKVLLPLAGMPVFGWSLKSVEHLEYVARVVVVVRGKDRAAVERTINEHFPKLVVTVVEGGSTRHGSEWNALQALAAPIDAGAVDVVAIHDTARPLAGGLFHDVIRSAAEHGGALPVRPMPALVPRDLEPIRAEETGLVGVQTPQAFRARPLLDAYRAADRDGFVGTDTASCVERYTDLAIHCVPCAATNLKITFPEDVELAERLLEKLALR
jgi:2-C-methyl-D-erythritol 4-phosphate cytidylyltransferase